MRQFDHDVVLKDGARLRLRPIVAEDETLLMAMHSRLSEQTAYQRFFTIIRRLPVTWAHNLANVDYQRRLALVAVDPRTSDVVAVARYESTANGQSAEVAFVVQDDWQNRGLGTALFGELLRAAAMNGIVRFRAWVLADNRRMLDLIARFGIISERCLEQGVVEVTFTAAPSVRAP